MGKRSTRRRQHPVLEPRIISGYNENVAIPWMVSIRDSYGFHYCGATLIADGWILTAAHCVCEYDISYDQAWVGGTVLKDRSEWAVLGIDKLFCHPEVCQTTTSLISSLSHTLSLLYVFFKVYIYNVLSTNFDRTIQNIVIFKLCLYILTEDCHPPP